MTVMPWHGPPGLVVMMKAMTWYQQGGEDEKTSDEHDAHG